jgi:heme/copper-type cytochrome/quinol oxidase subunit 2
MKTKLLLLVAIFFSSQVGQALACASCFGAPGAKSTQNMAVAVWVMIGVIMSVLGGVGAFSLHLWRHANTPLTPDKELTDEDLSKYE